MGALRLAPDGSVAKAVSLPRAASPRHVHAFRGTPPRVQRNGASRHVGRPGPPVSATPVAWPIFPPPPRSRFHRPRPRAHGPSAGLAAAGALKAWGLLWKMRTNRIGLRRRSGPMCTLSQNGYGDGMGFVFITSTTSARQDGGGPGTVSMRCFSFSTEASIAQWQSVSPVN